MKKLLLMLVFLGFSAGGFASSLSKIDTKQLPSIAAISSMCAKVKGGNEYSDASLLVIDELIRRVGKKKATALYLDSYQEFKSLPVGYLMQRCEVGQ